MSFLVEVVVNGRMNGGEFLEASHPPETKHGEVSAPQTAGVNSPHDCSASGRLVADRIRPVRATPLGKTSADQ